MDLHQSEKSTPPELFALFDSLEPVNPSDIRGLWKGRELRCGHPLEGLLTACHWYGKRFESNTEVYPLVFEKPDGSLFLTNPKRMPFSPLLNKLPDGLINFLFKCAYPYVLTHKPHAKLTELEFRGKTGAAMVYNDIPVEDIFRTYDDNTLLAIMDFKTDPSNVPFFFVLEKSGI
jgi:hypothetical protein